MAAIAGTLRWTGRFWAAMWKRITLPVRKTVKPLTFADQQKMQRDVYGVEHTPCRCPACRFARLEDGD